jgi:hypothetical protein
MRDVVELLERKRALLDRKQEAGPERLAEVERELQEIDQALNRLESPETPPTAPNQLSRGRAFRCRPTRSDLPRGPPPG